MALVLPTGVGKGQFDVKILDGGQELELKLQLPQPLSDRPMLHQQSVESKSDEYRMQMYHPKILRFEAYRKQFRHTSEDKIESKARISLPFLVQHRIFKLDNLGWVGNDCRVVYVDLQAHDDEYLVTRDKNSFEIC